MIKGITFDLDGVYFINGKANFIADLVKLGVPEEKAVSVFLKSDRMNKLYKVGKMTDEEFWLWALNEWDLKMSFEEVVNLLVKGYEINKPVIEFISVTGEDVFDLKFAAKQVLKGKLAGIALEIEKETVNDFEGNIWVTPPIAWFTKEAFKEDMRIWVETLKSVVKGKTINVVN